MKALKYSRQRESIKASLMNRRGHPTADALYANIHKESPNINLGTAYHSLNLLVETGGIKKLTCGDGTGHFNDDIRQHYHSIYTECNQVYDMDLGTLEELNQETQENALGITDSHHVLFYGRCRKCLGKGVGKGIDKPA